MLQEESGFYQEVLGGNGQAGGLVTESKEVIKQLTGLVAAGKSFQSGIRAYIHAAQKTRPKNKELSKTGWI